MTREEALKKIRKCLRLSASPEPAEAAAALRQAEALMRQYQIDAAEVESDVSRHDLASDGRQNTPSWEAYLVNRVAAVFGCQVLRSLRREGWSCVGVGVSPEIAGYALAVLLRKAKSARADYIKTQLQRCKPATKTRRADEYCLGWVIAIVEKLPVLAPVPAAVGVWMSKHSGGTLKPIRRKACRSNDLRHGFVDGQDVQLHHGVATSQAPKLLERTT